MFSIRDNVFFSKNAISKNILKKQVTCRKQADDCTVKDQQELLDKRIKRISSEAYAQGALLTQADIAILLGESTKTISRHITALEKRGELVPTRGKWKDIGVPE